MKVINLYGGPGTGKSTLATRLFSDMKLQGFKVEYVPEFAKDLTYAGRFKCLTNQLYITANQYYRMKIITDVDYLIADSPILLGKIYADIYNVKSDHYSGLVEELYNEFINFDFFIQRYKEYQTYGRNQTEEEAKAIDGLVLEELSNKNYYTIDAELKMKRKVKKIIEIISGLPN